MKHAIVTGGAGFIGSHLVDRLLVEGNWKITVIDNFGPFYDKLIKERNISGYSYNENVIMIEDDICDLEAIDKKLTGTYDVIIHLAAKAGVRPSILDPLSYEHTNVRGTQNLLEVARTRGIKQFVFASSSSVYGVNPAVPWSESNLNLLPISPYASSKISGELMGHVYSHLYNIRFIGLRFFTVYGPRQRPDLAISKFCNSLLDGKRITVFGDGSTKRDYTYINDIIMGIRAAMDYQASNYEIFNLGNSRTISMGELLNTLEQVFERKFLVENLPQQPGDVPQTFADITKAKEYLNYNPSTEFYTGISLFKKWMLEGDVSEV